MRDGRDVRSLSAGVSFRKSFRAKLVHAAKRLCLGKRLSEGVSFRNP